MMGKQDKQVQMIILDIDSMIPQNHLLRQIKKGVLTYGQLFHKGVSFETVYDGLHFGRIGREFAKGNIEPLYKELWDPK